MMQDLPLFRRVALFGICATVLSCVPAQEPVSISPPQDPPIPADTDPQSTPTGLKYSILKAAGDGAKKPNEGDVAVTHYRAWLPDGKMFDSSRKRGTPARLVIGKVMPGLSESLALLGVGALGKFTVPPALAFGEQGRPPMIPGNSDVIFEIELLEIVPPPVFPKSTPEAVKKTESGLAYEELTAGTGDAPTKDDVFTMQYAFWSPEGELLECSQWTEVKISGRLDDFRLPFLKEAPLLMKTGSVFRFDVPAKLGFGESGGPQPSPGSTIWMLELLKFSAPPKLPDFAMPADDSLKTTASGLKYEVIAEGEGESPKMGQPVTVHYAGWLPDGTLFDASFNRGTPSTFTLGAVIQGWNEGLQLMKPGAKYRFVIPPDLGYGKAGSPPKIGPDATLVFYVELIEFGK